MVFTDGSKVLTSTGTVGVDQGGIGVGTLASNGVLYGNGTSAVQALAVNSASTRKYLTQLSSGAPAWAELDNTNIGNEIEFIKSVSVNAAATGQTSVFNVPSGKTFIITGLEIEPTSVTNPGDHTWEWQLGSTDYTAYNIIPGSDTGVGGWNTPSTGRFERYNLLPGSSNYPTMPAGTNISFNVKSASPTGLTVSVHVRGYYI